MGLGTAPVFGFAPICYSPPKELKAAKGQREYISVLMRHVFRRPEHIASVGDLISAKKEQDNFLANLMNRFMLGKTKKDINGQRNFGSSMTMGSQERANFDNSNAPSVNGLSDSRLMGTSALKQISN